MRKSQRCPKCDHGEVLHVPRVQDSDHDDQGLGVRMGLITRETIGALQAYVCLGCGFVEWYVERPDRIDVDRLEGARVLRSPRGPAYR